MDLLTDKQRQAWEAVKQYGSNRKAAQALGVNPTVIDAHIRAAKKKMGCLPKSGPTLPTPHDPARGKRIMVLPDVQAKPGIDFSYLRRYGEYMMEKRPDIVVCIGDFADMPSLSSYDKGKKAFEGRRYKRDVEAAQFAMQAFLGPLHEHQKMGGTYRPRLVLTLGNHEHRINKAVDEDAKLAGVLSISDLAYEEYGWEVYPFLQVVVIEGVAFSHYFGTGVMGRPASSAAAQLRKTNMSCVAGHKQGKEIAYGYRADGRTITSIICGSAYEHEEDYLGPQGNRHWRGVFMLHEVKDGAFDEMPVSLGYINQRFPDVRYETPAYSMPTEAELQAGRL